MHKSPQHKHEDLTFSALDPCKGSCGSNVKIPAFLCWHGRQTGDFLDSPTQLAWRIVTNKKRNPVLNKGDEDQHLCCPLTFKCVQYIASTLTSTLTCEHTHTIYISHKQYTTYITHPQTYMPHSHIHTWVDYDVHQQMNVYWKHSSYIYTGHYVIAGNDQAPSLLAKCITFYFNITQFVFLDVCAFTSCPLSYRFPKFKKPDSCPFHTITCSFHSSETATSSLGCFLCSLSLLYTFKIIDLESVDYFFLIIYWFLLLRIL